MAAVPEYGEHLQSRFVPLMTGIGPVEAGVSLASALADLKSQGNLPDLVVSIGSAGSATLPQTGVFQVSAVSYRDMDATALGFEKGQTPFLDLPPEVTMPVYETNVPTARLATGASIVSGTRYRTINADMVDMETFALLRACQHFGVPLHGLRGISDGADELGHVGDWTQYLHIIDEKLASAVDELEIALRREGIRRT